MTLTNPNSPQDINYIELSEKGVAADYVRAVESSSTFIGSGVRVSMDCSLERRKEDMVMSKIPLPINLSKRSPLVHPSYSVFGPPRKHFNMSQTR